MCLYFYLRYSFVVFVFFFNDTATTEIYTLSLHDALPILGRAGSRDSTCSRVRAGSRVCSSPRSEEHTSELQSHVNLVCRLLLEKKKKKKKQHIVQKKKHNNVHTHIYR